MEGGSEGYALLTGQLILCCKADREKDRYYKMTAKVRKEKKSLRSSNNQML